MNNLWIFFSAGAYLCSARMIYSKNPVHSVFYLVLVFLNVSGLLLVLGIEFFALIQILVYVGALAIMFLFVVMLLDIQVAEIVAHQKGTYAISSIRLFVASVFVFLGVDQPFQMTESLWPVQTWESWNWTPLLDSWKSYQEAHNSLNGLGIALYKVHVDRLILASLLLRVAMIGAIVLTRRKRINVPAHDVFAQQNVEFNKIVARTHEKK